MAPGGDVEGLLGLLAGARGRTELFIESFLRVSRGRDILAPRKRELNLEALRLLEGVAGDLRDPVRGIGLAALANSVDVWMPWHRDGGIDARRLGEGVAYLEPEKALARLLDSPGTVAVLLDNAGEAVIDIAYALLALAPRASKVYLVARGGPYETDVTAGEAEELLRAVAERLGVDAGGVETVSTGSSYPGVAEGFAAPETVELVKSADLVISKGIANLEALAEYCNVDRDRVIVAFRAKCPVLARIYGVPLGAAVVSRGYPCIDGGRGEPGGAG